METDPEVLSNPLSISKLIMGMVGTSRASSTITPQEGVQLAKAVTENKKQAIESARGEVSDDRLHGEGGSGETKVPDVKMSSQSKTVYDDDGASTASDQMRLVDDPHPDSDNEASTDLVELSPPVVACTDQDLSDLSEGIDMMFTKLNTEVITPIQTNIRAHDQSLTGIRSALQSLSEQVNSLQVRITRLESAGPSVVPRPEVTPVTKIDTESSGPPAFSHRPTGSTVLPAPSVEKVAKFLTENPSYPKVQVIRNAKLVRLAAMLGVSVPEAEVAPAMWTESGLLKAFGI